MKYVWSILVAWLISATVMASELDLYQGTPREDVPTQIMLLVDTSYSMSRNLQGEECGVGDTNCETKMKILKETLLKFVDPGNDSANADTRWPDIYSVGLARYSSPGGVILARVQPLNTDVNGRTHRERLADLISALTPADYTPLVGSYLDTIEYLKGGRTVSGATTLSEAWAAAGSYKYAVGLPSKLVCGRDNDHIVVLTDGLSNRESMSSRIAGCHAGASCSTTVGQLLRSRVTGLTVGNEYLENCSETITTADPLPAANDINYQNNVVSNRQIWQCANALAGSIVNKDDLGNVSGIRTHTIAYSLGAGANCSAPIANPATPAQHLCNWAMAGGGSSYVANSAEDLAKAFEGLFEDFKVNDSFTAAVPGVSVNQANRFSFLDDIYYSVFKPTDRQVWYGNLKKYKLAYRNGAPVIEGDGSGPIDDNVEGDEDVNGDVKGDGFFDSDAKSFWFNASDYDPDNISRDGDNVILGGAALRIPAKADRSLFTSLSNNVTLEINDANASTVTDFMLPETFVDDDSEAELRAEMPSVVNWLRGDDALDINNEWARVTQDLPATPQQVPKLTRRLYGAPLNSSPVVINYASTGDGGVPLTANQQDNLVFVSTNDGKLYGVDAKTGNEKLAFVPAALLKRPADDVPSMMESYYAAARGNLEGDFIYGLDSTWTVWRQDVNGDGNITPSFGNDDDSKDFVYLYGGMRRGGRNYYGLDVTKANDSGPSLSQLFVVEGGKVNSPTEDMGQTWSEPVLGLIKYGGQAVVVMIVGGGYDPLYDADTAPAANDAKMGSQLYIIAAHNRSDTIRAGDVLWWGSSSTLSEPGNHQTIDALSEGISSDVMTDSIPSTVKVLDRDGDGYLDHIYVADLGGTLMRFDINDGNSGYGDLISNPRNVVVAELGRDAVSPLSKSDRRFFFPPSLALMRDIRGKHVAIAIGSGLITKPKDNAVDERLFFLKDYVPFGGTAAAANNQLRSYELREPSEKMLGSPLIVGGEAYFSTYYWGDNDADDSDACRATYGRAALYSYDPAVDEVTLIGKGYPQSLAGSLTTLLQETPAVYDDEGKLIKPAGTDFIGIGGTSAFDLPDVDLGNIRKTRWRQCPVDGLCQ